MKLKTHLNSSPKEKTSFVMYKSFIVLFSIFVIGIIQPSCKKGENDPFLSLRTRKNRLCGEWKVVEEVSERTDSNGEITTLFYDGEIEHYTTYNPNTNQTTETTKTISIEWTFKKDFSYEYKETTPNYRKKEKGSWCFIDKSKLKDVKKKELIGLRPSFLEYENNNGISSSSNSTGDQLIDGTFAIDRLKNNELVFKRDSKIATTTNEVTEVVELHSVTTLKQK